MTGDGAAGEVPRQASPRPRSNVRVTALAQILAGADCEWSHWFQANHYLNARTPPHPDSALWTQRHDALVESLTDQLLALGSENLEHELEMKITFDDDATLIGRADVVATDVERSVIDVYEAKGGRPRASDLIQLQLYMWMMEATIEDPDRWVVRGRLVRQDGQERIDGLPEGFVDRAMAGIERLIGAEPLERSPGPFCRLCPITSVDCPDRIED